MDLESADPPSCVCVLSASSTDKLHGAGAGAAWTETDSQKAAHTARPVDPVSSLKKMKINIKILGGGEFALQVNGDWTVRERCARRWSPQREARLGEGALRVRAPEPAYCAGC